MSWRRSSAPYSGDKHLLTLAEVACCQNRHKIMKITFERNYDQSHSIMTNHSVFDFCDQQQWIPALTAHVELFGQAPRLAAADRGFWNSANEKAAAQLGVEQVVLPGRGRLSAARAARQKERWFRRGQSWRAGIEARLSTLKHRFGMQRALYKGEIGFERHVGWCIIAHNLVAMSRARMKNGNGRCRSG